MIREIRKTDEEFNVKNQRITKSVQTIKRYFLGIKIYDKKSNFIEVQIKEQVSGMGFK